MKSILAALIFLAAVASNPSAEVVYPDALVLEPGYASGPPLGFPGWARPEYGDPLVMVGLVSAVGAPLDGLLPAGAHELTYVFEGSACYEYGMWDNIPCSGGEFAAFQGGTVTFYLDTTPDADFANPASFRDGEVALLAQSTHLFVADDDPQEACPQVPDVPDVVASFSFVGGAWFSRVSSNGFGWYGSSGNELEFDVPAGLVALGYIFRVEGAVTVHAPVAVESTTWGRVKALYR